MNYKSLITSVAGAVSVWLSPGTGNAAEFQTEMLALDLNGPLMIRESPSKASLGRTALTGGGGAGSFHIDSFFDVFTEISLAGSPPFEASGHMRFSGSSSDGVTFDTEMLQLDLSGPGAPFMIRESPTLPSRGQTKLIGNSGGPYHIDSFFDIFTELSFDGGQSWTPPQPGPLRLSGQQVPETGSTLAALIMGMGSLLCLRRKVNA